MKKENKIIITALAAASTIAVTAAAGLKLKSKYKEYKSDKKIETAERVLEMIKSFEKANKTLSSAGIQCNLPLVVSTLTTPDFLSREMPDLVVDYFDCEQCSDKVEAKLSKLLKDITKYIPYIKDGKDNEEQTYMIDFVTSYSELLKLLKVAYSTSKIVDEYQKMVNESPTQYNKNNLSNAKTTLMATVSNISFFASRIEKNIQSLKKVSSSNNASNLLSKGLKDSKNSENSPKKYVPTKFLKGAVTQENEAEENINNDKDKESESNDNVDNSANKKPKSLVIGRIPPKDTSVTSKKEVLDKEKIDKEKDEK